MAQVPPVLTCASRYYVEWYADNLKDASGRSPQTSADYHLPPAREPCHCIEYVMD